MPCFHPLRAFRDSGGIRFVSDSSLSNLSIPCGRCSGCRLERSRQWAVRIMHEASLYEFNSFITLTYDPGFLPEDGGLHHRHFQLFFKRLRKHFPDQKLRYYMCGEYGDENGRPHFHAIIFNLTFTDLTILRSAGDNSLFCSDTLNKLWGFGFCSIGAVTFQSAAYVARYVMDKVTGDLANAKYQSFSEFTGEVFDRRPPYNNMSRRPGIGADWYKKFRSDVYPHDRVVVDGVECKPPRYYDKLYSRDNVADFERIKSERFVDMCKSMEDNTNTRLVAKEIVTNARISKLKRGLM